MEFDIAFASLTTALATAIAALATAILARFCRKILNRLDQQHAADIYFRALPYRLSSYKELKNHYSNILTDGGILIGAHDRSMAPTHDKIDTMRTSLHTAEMFFTNEGETRKIYQLIKGIESKIEEHGKIVREYHEIDSRSVGTEEKEPHRIRCLKSSDAIRSEYVKLTTKIEDLLKRYDQ